MRKPTYCLLKREFILAKKRQTAQIYTKEFKLKVVNLVMVGGLSSREVARQFQIPDSSVVRRWIREYKTAGKEAFEQKTTKKGRPKSVFKTLEEEVKWLRAENQLLKKLRDLQRR
jgi:transposase